VGLSPPKTLVQEPLTGMAIRRLHAFQKNSRRDLATSKRDMDFIRQRLAGAERLHRERQN